MRVTADIRVLVVQYFPVAQYGTAHFLDAQDGISVVCMASTGREGIALAKLHAPDVVVSGLDFPDMSGIDTIIAIRDANPAVRCIVMTGRCGDDSIHRALDAGAQAYLTKDMPMQALADAVVKVHSGQRVLPDSIEKILSTRPPNSDLTPRERVVLALLTNGMNNKRISVELNITEGTVKHYVNSIFRQLGAASRTEAAAIAARRGIVYVTAEADPPSLTSIPRDIYPQV